MAIKTFNIDKEVHKRFSGYCKEHGMSRSKQVELFMRCQVAKDDDERNTCLNKLEKLRKGGHVKIEDFADTL